MKKPIYLKYDNNAYTLIMVVWKVVIQIILKLDGFYFNLTIIQRSTLMMEKEECEEATK